EIIEGIQSGRDDKVLAYLYKETLPMVRNFVMKNQGSEEEANDIFQDAVIRFYHAVKKGAFQEKCSVSTFIFGIGRNLWINAVKRKGRQMEDTSSEFIQDSVDLLSNIISDEKVKAVNELLGKIGENCAQLLKYSIYEELSMREICQRMGFSSEDVAKTNNYRCKQKLIKLVDGDRNLMTLFDL
ncbi:MAG: RNA polymerase sigma factor, partial [Cytophagales bacterium]|nr:RNA polymerase sigma factor [Cytophagales bacterium]